MAELVDTTILIRIEQRGEDISLLERAAPGEVSAVATITISELLTGAYRADTAARRRRREEFAEVIARTHTVIPFDYESALVHARIWAELTAAGRSIGSHDLILAAVALTHGHAVLTDNVREFERVPRLSVRQPAW